MEVYYTPNEVALHNSPDSLWVSFLGKVYDLTDLCREHAGDVLLRPILQYGGRDISHWFEKSTGEVVTHVDPQTGCRSAYTPMGRFLHVPPPYPATEWRQDFDVPWWKDTRFWIGHLTARPRRVRIRNTLTYVSHVLEVCCEDTLTVIRRRYSDHNAHIHSYTWKFNGEVLDMDKTLSENSICDQQEELCELGIDIDDFLPVISIHYNDDLTVA